MRKNQRASYTQSYNCQATADVEGSYLIVGKHLTQSPVDKNELLPAYHSIPTELDKPTGIPADAGYVNTTAFDTLEEQGKCEVHCSVHREDAHSERRYDFRPPSKSERKARTVIAPGLIAMRAKLASEEGKSIYRRLASTIGTIKSVIGFREFSLRGKEKVTGEWDRVCLSYNIKRLHGLKLGLAG